MASLGRLVASLALDTAEFVGGLDKASYQAKQFERNVTKTFSAAASAAKGFIGAMVGVAAIGSFGKQIKDAIDYADALGKAAQVAGVTANELGGMRAAAQLAGVSTQEMDVAVKKLSQAMTLAYDGGEKQVDMFKRLGVQIRDTVNGGMLPATEVIKQVADRFATMQDGAQKVAIATELFGKAGANLIPMLNQGSEALQQQIGFWQEYYGVSDEAAKAAEAFNDTLTMVSTVMQGGFMRIAEALLPTLQTMASYILDVSKEMNGASAAGDGMRVVIAAVSIAFVGLTNGVRLVLIALGTLGKMMSAIAEGRWGDVGVAFSKGMDEMAASSVRAGQAIKELIDNTGSASAAQAASMQKVTRELDKTAESNKKATDAAKKLASETKKAMADLDAALRTPLKHVAEFSLKFNDLDSSSAKMVRSLKETTNGLVRQAETMNLTASEMIDYRIATLEAQKGNVLFGDGVAEVNAALDEQIKALRMVRESMAKGDAAKAMEEGAKKAKDEWQKTSDSIRDSLTDALLRGFESGADFAKNFTQTLKNMFNTLVLRPIIQAIVQPIAGGVNSIIGGITGGGGAGGGGGGLLGNLGGMLGGGNGGLGGMLGSLGFGSSLSGGAMTGALGMIGAAAPWIAGAVAIASALGAFKRGGPKGGGSAIIGDLVTGGLDSSGRLFTPATADAMVGDIAKGVTRAYEDTLKALGGKGSLAFGIGFDTDPKGTAENRLKVLAQVNGSDAYRVWDQSVGRDDAALEAALQLESQRALLSALQASEFPAAVAAALNSVVASTASEEQVREALDFANAVKELTDVFDAMGDPMKAADEMLAAAGQTAYDVFIKSRESLLELTDSFDGTLDSTKKLTAASADYARAMVTVIAQIKALKADVDSMFKDTAQRIRESVMTEDELYADLQRQAQAAFEALQTATDPAEVAKYADLLNSLLERSFGMLSPEEQKAAAGEYLAQIEMVNGSVQSKLDAMADVLIEAGQTDREFIQSALDSIVEKFGKAGEDFTAGADTIAATAARGVQVDITVEDGRIDYEVTG
jgi:hypothetical protein